MNSKLNNFLRRGKKALYRVVPLDMYLRIQYWVRFHQKLDLNNPKRFSEKIYCLKIINGREKINMFQKCHDKYRVREYIKEKLGEEESANILNELYGVYDNADEINYDALPYQFVIKVTQSSGYNIICLQERQPAQIY